MSIYQAIGLFVLGFYAGGWSVHWMGTRDWLRYLQPRREDPTQGSPAGGMLP